MKLEDQVCSFDLSVKLKELDIKKDSQFYYVEAKSIGDHILKNGVWMIAHLSQITGIGESFVSAFTSAELGELLPNCILRPKLEPFDNYRLTIRKFISVDEKMNETNNFIINYECDTTEASGANAWITRKLVKNIYDANLSNAMAKMLIYLIENDLLQVLT